MGLISKIFDKTKSETDDIKEEQVIHFIEKFKEKTKKETISITLNTKTVGITDSEFGGIPYLPKDKGVPTNQNNEPYRLLAQIRMDDLPTNHVGLPSIGLLQFWILDDDMMGMEANYQVIYYPTIDETITKEDIDKKYCIKSNDHIYFPLEDEFGLVFNLKDQEMQIGDYQFDQTFIDLWNNENPNHLLERFNDLDQKYTDIIYEEINEGGHRIGGYPYFTQCDPRAYDMQDYEILLLQIDTDSVDGKDIMWGDCGVANFFITVEDLKNLDFSKVFYTWDCC